jgi:hypothetical protein
MEYVADLKKNGWAFIPGDYYSTRFDGRAHEENLAWQSALLHSYSSLEVDPYSLGNRYRSYSQFKLEAGEVKFGKFYDYLQTKEYNPDTGGVVRTYPPISTVLLSNPFFYALIASDIQFVSQHGGIGEMDELEMGVHVFRYKASVDSPAFSSPVWLHKDDEDIVFVHHIKTSAHALGGDSLIAQSGRKIERVLKLSSHLDTLVVDHQKFHAVTPLGTNSSEPAIRDVILVTFQRKIKKV